jgi:hypothetical protein
MVTIYVFKNHQVNGERFVVTINRDNRMYLVFWLAFSESKRTQSRCHYFHFLSLRCYKDDGVFHSKDYMC